MQPFHAFKPDGVILFSDILTPLPGMGINFEIIESKGPIIEEPIRTLSQIENLQELNPVTKIGWSGIRIEDFNTIIWSNVETIGGQVVTQ